MARMMPDKPCRGVSCEASPYILFTDLRCGCRLHPLGDEDKHRATLDAVASALAATPAARQQQRHQPGGKLQPTVATSNPKLTSTNLLTELDQATQQVIGAKHLSCYCNASDRAVLCICLCLTVSDGMLNM